MVCFYLNRNHSSTKLGKYGKYVLRNTPKIKMDQCWGYKRICDERNKVRLKATIYKFDMR